jgi:hypothetical protein
VKHTLSNPNLPGRQYLLISILIHRMFISAKFCDIWTRDSSRGYPGATAKDVTLSSQVRHRICLGICFSSKSQSVGTPTDVQAELSTRFNPTFIPLSHTWLDTRIGVLRKRSGTFLLNKLCRVKAIDTIRVALPSRGEIPRQF